jgi:phosphate transport system protein
MIASVQNPHIVRSYDDDLHRLRSLITLMGALCDAQLTGAADAIADADAAGAQAVIHLDTQVDSLHTEAEAAAINIFMRYAPLADDLREVVATLKIAGWLERAADQAKNVARRALRLATLDAAPAAVLVAELAMRAKHVLRDALSVYVDRDAVEAATVIADDRAIDGLYDKVFADLLAYATANPLALEAVTHLQFIAKNFERIGDEATNIAEQVRFAVTGETAEQRDTSSAALPLPVLSAG